MGKNKCEVWVRSGLAGAGAPERLLWDVECQAAYLALSW